MTDSTDPGELRPDLPEPPAQADVAAPSTRVTLIPSARSPFFRDYYVVGDPNGAIVTTVSRGEATSLDLDVPIGGSVTEARYSTVTNQPASLVTTTGIQPNDFILFDDLRALAAMGSAEVTLVGAPTAPAYRVVGPCAAGQTQTAVAHLQVHADGCVGSLVALTIEDVPRIAINTATIHVGDSLAIDGPWVTLPDRPVAITGAPADATYQAALFDAQSFVVSTPAATVDAARRYSLPGFELTHVEWIASSGRTWTMTVSADRVDEARAIELLPELAAPTLRDNELTWSALGVQADATALATIDSRWRLVARAGASSVRIPMIREINSARVALVEAGIDYDEVRQAPRALLGVETLDPWTLSSFDHTRVTAADAVRR